MAHTIEDYAFWFHAHKRMLEILADKASSPELLAKTEERRARYVNEMAIYEGNNGKPTPEEIEANRPVIGKWLPGGRTR